MHKITVLISRRLPSVATFLSVMVALSAPAVAAIQLSNDPVAGIGVQNFLITPDSSRVVYRGEINTASISEMFSASTTSSGTQTQLNNVPVAGGETFGGFQLTPDGNTVVYIGDLVIDSALELFSASTSTASTEVKLNDTPPDTATQDVNQSKLTPDGTIVIYRADLNTDSDNELYSATVGAPNTQVRLTNAPVPNGDVSANDFFPTADGTRVVYHGDLDSDGVDELYSASTAAAGTQIKLNNAPASIGEIDDDFLLTPDGARVIYRGDLDTNFINELYSAPTDEAGMQIKLSGPTVAGFSGVNSVYSLTPDGSRVMYAGVLDTGGVTELYSAPTDSAGMQIKLNNTPVTDGDVFGRGITADGARAVFTGDLLVNDQFDLFSAPIDAAGGQIQLNTNTAGGDVLQFRLTSDGSRVVYPGAMNISGQGELYSAQTDAAGTQITLTTNPLGSDGFIAGNFTVSPDDSRVTYTGVFTNVGIFDLYVASATAEGTQVALTSLTAGQNVLSFEFSPDSQFVVYSLDTDGNFSPDTLFAADAMGQNPAFQLSDPLIAGGQITSFSISPDSQTVIFRANQDNLGEFNLFSASLSFPGFTADVDNDGDVDGLDFLLIQRNNPALIPAWEAQYGSGALLASSQTVPEPTSIALFVCVTMALTTSRIWCSSPINSSTGSSNVCRQGSRHTRDSWGQSVGSR